MTCIQRNSSVDTKADRAFIPKRRVVWLQKIRETPLRRLQGVVNTRRVIATTPLNIMSPFGKYWDLANRAQTVVTNVSKMS